MYRERNVPAARMHGKPTHASQVMRPSVLTLLVANPRMAAMAAKAAVHIPCVETEFNPMVIPSIPEALTNI